MIIHSNQYGSHSYEYEIGDRVIVKRTIRGGWFDIGPQQSKCCKIIKIWDDKHYPYKQSLLNTSFRTAMIEVHYSDQWGLAECFPWMIDPHPETLENSLKKMLTSYPYPSILNTQTKHTGVTQNDH